MADADWPSVSVVMPVRDEADDLSAAVDAVLAQGYPGRFEVCLAVAPSTDGTADIARRLADDARVSVVANPSGSTPAGLNAAIAATTGDVVVRVDAHSELSPGYVRRAVDTLRRTGAVNAGGIQRATGRTPFEDAVSVAMTSRFGVGDAKFHFGGAEGPTDTVYLGVFDRAALEAVGGFDETLIRNQDYELNWRLREAGGTVWFDPELEVTYRPRGSVRRLARQYAEYGWWKAEVVRRHPRSLRWRQLVAPATVVGIVGGVVAARRWPPAALAPAVYGAGVLAAAASASDRAQRARLCVVYPTMHLSWGVGFLGAAITRFPRTRWLPSG
ncbi:MAG: glycosyltransferase family 2 protein [Actinomycetota bacterium]